MAKVVRNPVVQGISGAVGNLVFRQMPDGSTYVSAKPDFSHRRIQRGAEGAPEPFSIGGGVCA